MSIGERTKKDAADFFAIRKERMGIEPDKSVESMPTHPDAFKRRLPEMGKPRGDVGETMSMGGTIDKWNKILAAKEKYGKDTAKKSDKTALVLARNAAICR